MLTEEAHHMFVGESGVARTIQRTCEVMKEHGLTDPSEGRQFGVIDLNTLQKFVNFHCSVTLDLFGSEVSSNAATYYTTGLKGRYEEGKRPDDHRLSSDEYPVLDMEAGKIVEKGFPALTALNARLRDDYIEEIQGGLNRWNRIPEQNGIPFRFKLPHVAFHRKIGNFAGQSVSPHGEVITEAEWNSRRDEWLPSASDHQYIESLMGQVLEPGKFANWIAPPARGINGKPIDFEYVRFN
jgi:benzoyl-CoA 2,3-dioxygenase component B